MACFWLHQNETTIDILEVEEINGVTYYNIEITVDNVKWSVQHRYSDFLDLHNVLVANYGLTKDIRPPKKVLRNKSPVLIEERRIGLETYLRKVLNFLKRTMPRVFVHFLYFHSCDIFFLIQGLALEFYFQAESILSSTRSYTFNPLQMHSISEIVKNPFPQVEQYDSRYDPCHLLDFCLQLHHLCIEGSAPTMQHSNIILNNLPFELSSFKKLKILELNCINFESISSVGNLRQTLTKLTVHKTAVTNISQILQCDVLHKSTFENNQVWCSLKEVDFSNNNLTEIDESIKLLPNIKVMRLNQNKISSIPDLSSLSKLIDLRVSDNLISSCDNLHLKLGNILNLDLSQNNITSLKGFAKLYSLHTLDLNSNQLRNIEEVSYIGDLPCLENLILTGNALSTTVDYRVKVFGNFKDQAKDIYLDNEKPSEAELDRTAIIRALRIVKEGKTPIVNNILLK